MLGGYALLYPRARVLTLIFVFFIFFVEIPAMVLLGIWIFLQFLPAVGQLASPDCRRQGGVAYFAHIGGFLFGLAAIKLFAHTAQRRVRGRRTAISGLLEAMSHAVGRAGRRARVHRALRALTISVIASTGLDILTVLALFFLAVIARARDRRPAAAAAR